jgi:hypothetical protein
VCTEYSVKKILYIILVLDYVHGFVFPPVGKNSCSVGQTLAYCFDKGEIGWLRRCEGAAEKQLISVIGTRV